MVEEGVEMMAKENGEEHMETVDKYLFPLSVSFPAER